MLGGTLVLVEEVEVVVLVAPAEAPHQFHVFQNQPSPGGTGAGVRAWGGPHRRTFPTQTHPPMSKAVNHATGSGWVGSSPAHPLTQNTQKSKEVERQKLVNSVT